MESKQAIIIITLPTFFRRCYVIRAVKLHQDSWEILLKEYNAKFRCEFQIS